MGETFRVTSIPVVFCCPAFIATLFTPMEPGVVIRANNGSVIFLYQSNVMFRRLFQVVISAPAFQLIVSCHARSLLPSALITSPEPKMFVISVLNV